MDKEYLSMFDEYNDLNAKEEELMRYRRTHSDIIIVALKKDLLRTEEELDSANVRINELQERISKLTTRGESEMKSMKARYKHHQDETVYNLSTRELIGLGIREGHGRIECLEDRVNHLIFVIASLIDRSGLSDEEVLEITGADLRVKIANDE